MEYKKTELTRFAKDCVMAQHMFSVGACFADEISKSDIGRELNNRSNDDLLIEIAKRYAKYAKEENGFDVETGEIQECQKIIEKIVYCCEEHGWFEE